MTDLWVVIPAHNERDWIGATLNALAAQRHRKFTTLVVDNVSTDGTAEVVRAFAQAHPDMQIELITESQKGTGAAADTGMRHAVEAGARLLARTDADCLPAPDWTERMVAAFDSGLRMVCGLLLPRTDEGVSRASVFLARAALVIAGAYGRVRLGNRGPQYLGPYVMAPGCNIGITAELYLAAGGFPRSKIEELHEDRALMNAVRTLTTAYALRRDVRVYGSQRRLSAWGLRNTLAWYHDHRYRPEVVDIR